MNERSPFTDGRQRKEDFLEVPGLASLPYGAAKTRENLHQKQGGKVGPGLENCHLTSILMP